MRFAIITGCIIIFMATACVGPTQLNPADQLVGDWESVAVADESGSIVGMTLSFQADGSFSALMNMSDGSEISQIGRYRALESDIIFTIVQDDGQELIEDMTYSFKEGLLSIFDTQTAGFGIFKRVK